jgi:hypothetical protein
MTNRLKDGITPYLNIDWPLIHGTSKMKTQISLPITVQYTEWYYIKENKGTRQKRVVRVRIESTNLRD